eukprot:365028-Chlamydomonas_euryale.AAC.28
MPTCRRRLATPATFRACPHAALLYGTPTAPQGPTAPQMSGWRPTPCRPACAVWQCLPLVTPQLLSTERLPPSPAVDPPVPPGNASLS